VPTETTSSLFLYSSEFPPIVFLVIRMVHSHHLSITAPLGLPNSDVSTWCPSLRPCIPFRALFFPFLSVRRRTFLAGYHEFTPCVNCFSALAEEKRPPSFGAGWLSRHRHAPLFYLIAILAANDCFCSITCFPSADYDGLDNFTFSPPLRVLCRVSFV